MPWGANWKNQPVGPSGVGSGGLQAERRWRRRWRRRLGPSLPPAARRPRSRPEAPARPPADVRAERGLPGCAASCVSRPGSPGRQPATGSRHQEVTARPARKPLCGYRASRSGAIRAREGRWRGPVCRIGSQGPGREWRADGHSDGGLQDFPCRVASVSLA